LVMVMPALDASERIQAEWMSRNHKAFYRTLCRVLPDAFCVIDTDNNILFVNNAAVDLLEYESEDDFIGKNLLDFIDSHDHEAVLAGLQESGFNSLTLTSEYHLLGNGGVLIPIEATACPIAEAEVVNGYLCVARDIRARKHAEKKYSETAKRALFYVDLMAHDISNQLQVMLSCAELLAGSPQTTELVNLLTESIRRCQNIISATTMMERLVTVPLYKQSLLDTLHDTLVQFVNIHEDVCTHADIVVTASVIMADDFLKQLLAAILDNAVRHNESVIKHVWVSLIEKEEGYLLTIDDNGPGIVDTLKDRLFESTQRSSGIGLHLCRTIIEKYGGHITVSDRIEDSPHQGASFRLWFPYISNHIDIE
jgi:PAS domain S-box-containing protein